MTVNDVEDKGSLLLVNIPDSKTHTRRSFTVVNNENENYRVVDLVRKYSSIRPKDADNTRFFLRYQKGRCFKQVVGKNTFAKIPSEIARFLNLENPEKYTGHAFRRTSATLLANTGIDILGLKRHGGWKSAMVAEGYVAESISVKVDVANRIMYDRKNAQEVVARPSTSAMKVEDIQAVAGPSTSAMKIEDIQDSISINEELVTHENLKETLSSAFSVTNMANCTFNVTINKN